MRLKKIEKIELLTDFPMWKCTTFKIGGKADKMYLPGSAEEISALIKFFKTQEQKYIILGNCSNVLVRDEGIRSPIIKIDSKMSEISLKECDDGSVWITAQAGALLSKISAFAAERGIAGLEFASGIPGSLGGAVYMNAGAYGGEMKDVVYEVEIVDRDGNIKIIPNEQMEFAYRLSYNKKYGGVVTSATFKLAYGNKDKIKAIIDELTERRTSKQPLTMPSAGSVFKRPVGHYAGQLIEQSGLKGYQIGGAQVSEKHAGFIVNLGNATADDVIALIQHIQKTVNETFDVFLEPEICIIP